MHCNKIKILNARLKILEAVLLRNPMAYAHLLKHRISIIENSTMKLKYVPKMWY